MLYSSGTPNWAVFSLNLIFPFLSYSYLSTYLTLGLTAGILLREILDKTFLGTMWTIISQSTGLLSSKGPLGWFLGSNRRTGMGCDLLTWHANLFIWKVCLCMQMLCFRGFFPCFILGPCLYRTEQCPGLQNMPLPKHKSSSLSGTIRNCSLMLSYLPYWAN